MGDHAVVADLRLVEDLSRVQVGHDADVGLEQRLDPLVTGAGGEQFGPVGQSHTPSAVVTDENTVPVKSTAVEASTS